MLSRDERRRLQQIEGRLQRDDPRFAARMRTEPARTWSPALVWLVPLLCLLLLVAMGKPAAAAVVAGAGAAVLLRWWLSPRDDADGI